MKFNFKQLLFFGLATLLSGTMLQAQEKYSNDVKRSGEGEIVMSQAQLDTFLNKLAEKRRAVLAKRKEEQGEVEGLKMERLKDRQKMNEERAARMGYYPPQFRGSAEKTRSSAYNEDRLYYEFSRVNDRIDRLYEILMTNSQSSPVTAARTSESSAQPTIIYEREQRQTAIAPEPEQLTPTARQTAKTSGNETASKTMVRDTAMTHEIYNLQSRINAMDEKMRVLDKLGETTGSDAYDEEANELKNQIDRLNQELAEKQKALDAKNELRAKLAQYEDYSQIIYFANNSAALSSGDQAKLKNVVETIENNKPHLTAVLHGFSSSTGSAEYNEKLSFRRAEAVKKALLEAGLNSKDLIIQNHGVDASGTEDQARRVEVNLIIN